MIMFDIFDSQPHTRACEAIIPLFEAPHLRLVIDAIAAGNSPARIWVDHPDDPRSVAVWDEAHCVYLAGAADNVEFNRALASWVTDTLIPGLIARQAGVVKLYSSSGAWDAIIPPLFENAPLARPLMRLDRVFYRLDHPAIPNWRDRIPPGFTVRPIDAALLESPLHNRARLIDEIESCWESMDLFLRHGFGACALHGETIVGWCTGEYVSAEQCGLGIETIEEYMNRGIGTLTASASVEICTARGLTPHWDSWKGNLPSVAVAEKVGFRRVEEYAVFLAQLAD